MRGKRNLKQLLELCIDPNSKRVWCHTIDNKCDVLLKKMSLHFYSKNKRPDIVMTRIQDTASNLTLISSGIKLIGGQAFFAEWITGYELEKNSSIVFEFRNLSEYPVQAIASAQLEEVRA